MNETSARPNQPLRQHYGVIAVIALAVSALLSSCADPAPVPAPTSATAASPAPVAVVAPAETAQAALSRANSAFRAGRMVEPAGDNALEHALRALQLEPSNAGANEILVDITPIAASSIEADIAAADYAEAERVMALLSSANPDSMIVQNLQRRLTTATRKVEPPPAAAVVATTSPPVKPARDTAPAAAPSQPVATTSAPIAAREVPAPARAPPARPPTPATADSDVSPVAAVVPTRAPEPAAAVTVTDPVAVNKVSPEYPPAARKRRAEGWVELQFMVGVDGVPRQIEVLRAQPAGLFDRSALRALSRWKFRPGQRDGRDVEARARTTINFKLS